MQSTFVVAKIFHRHSQAWAQENSRRTLFLQKSSPMHRQFPMRIQVMTFFSITFDREGDYGRWPENIFR